eukprot:7081526-Pyramimonas_sp.AAC.1
MPIPLLRKKHMCRGRVVGDEALAGVHDCKALLGPVLALNVLERPLEDRGHAAPPRRRLVHQRLGP